MPSPVCGQTGLGLFDVLEVGLPQVYVEYLHQAPLEELQVHKGQRSKVTSTVYASIIISQSLFNHCQSSFFCPCWVLVHHIICPPSNRVRVEVLGTHTHWYLSTDFSQSTHHLNFTLKVLILVER